MTQYYSCGHKAELDDFDNYTNGSYALWDEDICSEDGWQTAECYGVLCNDCMKVYRAIPCKLGGKLFNDE